MRAAANSIRSLHRQEWDRAEALAGESRAHLDDAQAALRDFPSVYHAGFLHDGEKEYAEAVVTRALLQGDDVPGPDALAIGDAAWLHGLAEAIGELRRFLLDRLRESDFARGEALLAAMDGVHDHLAALDYPDAITHGLRRATDVARSILERTRGDLTATVVQGRLTRALDEHTAGPASPAPSSPPVPPSEIPPRTG